MAHSQKKAAFEYLKAIYETKIIKDALELVTDEITIGCSRGTFIHGKSDMEKRTKQYWERYTDMELKITSRWELGDRGKNKYDVRLHLNLTHQDGHVYEKDLTYIITFLELKPNRFLIDHILILYEEENPELDYPETPISWEDASKWMEKHEKEHKDPIVRHEYLRHFKGKLLPGNIPV